MDYTVDPWPDWSDGVPWCNTNRCCKFTHHTGRCSVHNDIPASLCKPAVREMTKGLCHGTSANPVEVARLVPEMITQLNNSVPTLAITGYTEDAIVLARADGDLSGTHKWLRETGHILAKLKELYTI